MQQGYPPELVFTLILVRRGKVRKSEIGSILEQAYHRGLIRVEPGTALKLVEEHIHYLKERGLIREHDGLLTVARERIPLVPLRLLDDIARVMESNAESRRSKED